ncbi:MAG: CHASE2 domain-containing protein [Planctomycetia bacterium]
MPDAIPRLSAWGPARRLAYGALLGLCVALLLGLARGSQALEALELRFVDVRTRTFVGTRAADPRIVLCVVHDEDHLRLRRSDVAPLEAWPWGLHLHRHAFRALAHARPRVVLVDLLHVDRGASREDVTLPEGTPADTPWVQLLVAEADEARELAAAYAQAGPVVLGFQLDGAPGEYEQAARARSARARLELGPGFAPRGGLERMHATLPVSGLLEGARLLGFVNVQPDLDGVSRRAVVVGRWGAQRVPSLALAGAWLAADGEQAVDGEGVRLGESHQPLGPEGDFLVNFRALPATRSGGASRSAYAQVRPADLVQVGLWLEEGRDPASWPEPAREVVARLRDAIVVYGAHLQGSEDVVPDPLVGAQLGPEFQATVVDNLLHGDGRVRPPRGVDLAVLLLACLLAGALGTLLRGRWLPHLPAVAALSAVGALGWGLFAYGLVLDVVTPALGLLLAWAGAGVLRLSTEGRRNRWLESTFGRYVAPEVVEALKREPALLALGGRRRDLSVMFCDIQGFTSISETLAPEQVVRLLNRHLTDQSQAVIATGGVIDKFIGDAVMAFWGDPLETPDHALRAVKAALASRDAVAALQPLAHELGLPTLRVRYGLCSGPAVVGNMGSEERFSYTCMGDTVNVASRLEGANKAFGTQVLVAAPTYLMVREQVLARRIADVVVAGRQEALRAYEVLALAEGAPDALRQHVAHFQQAHEALRRGDLPGAREALARARAARPGDGPTAWLSSVEAAISSGQMPSPWDGRAVLSGK